MTDTPYAFTVSTPDGPFAFVADHSAVLASGWTTVARLLAQFGMDCETSPAGPARDSLPDQAIAAVNAYYSGDLRAPQHIPVRQATGEFHHQVREVLRETRPGDLLTYTQLAARAGNPRAVRAAASACARNATALFIPCHRVVRSDGSLGGFRYGLGIKQSLLDREKAAKLSL